MSDINIFRSATDLERQDFRIIGDEMSHPTLFVRKKFFPVYSRFVKQKKPFCLRCTQRAFEKKVKDSSEFTAIQEIKEGFANFDFLNDSIPEIAKNYGSPERFIWIGDQDALERVKVGIGDQMAKTGIFRNYKCKECGGGISIEIRESEMHLIKEDPVKKWTEENPKEAKEIVHFFSKENFENMSPSQREIFFKRTGII